MTKGLKVFITYAHKNSEAKGKLITYLAVLKQNGLIDVWHDNEILPGDKTMNNFFTICYIGILVSILGCSQKSVSEKDLLPQRPYDSESLMYADIPVKELENLIVLLEERLNARTLTDYLAVESKIDRKLGFLLGAVSLETGIKKYGDPGFSDPALRATRVLYGFSRVRTKEHLQMAIHVVAHTKHLLETERN